ncbi:MAG: hypothetical protein CVV45_15725 [Spirochaetae bacterium HGW-Spirochaetae-10]|nr:MAG: hypothetical protein CVV45_15725 [Spirochaetae bacterium HGW-Spirochaetae-10]
MSDDVAALLEDLIRRMLPIHTATFGRVKAFEIGPPHLATIEILHTEEKIGKVRWLGATIPRSEALCLVLFCDNTRSRAFAISFDEIDEVDLTIGAGPLPVTIRAKDGSAEISCGTVKLSTNGTKLNAESGSAKATADPTSGWVFFGKVKFEDDVTMEKKLDVKGKTTIQDIPFDNHGHPYVDTPVGNSVTGGAQALAP